MPVLKDIDALIVIIYLVITMYIGVKASRKLEGAKDYIISNQKLSTPILTATLLATLIGGGHTIGTAGKIYSVGLVFTIVSLGTAITHLISAKWVVPHFQKFKEASSIGDIMGSIYGEKAKLIVGIIGFIKSFGSIGGQLLAMSYLLNVLLGIPIKLSILINAGIVITYSALGGVRAVTATDIFQFILLVIIIPIISSVCVSKVGGLSELISQIPENKLKLPTDEIWNYLALFIMFCIPYLAPHIVHKYVMADDARSIKKALYSAAILDVTLTITISVISFSMLITNNTLPADGVIPYVISDILPPVIKGLSIAGMLAVIMSTADSILHAATVLIIHDVLPVVSHKDYNETFKMRLMVITTFIVGILSVLTAWTMKSIVDIIVYFGSFYMVAVTIPLWIGIHKGTKINPKAFYISVIVSLLSVFILNWLLGHKFYYINTLIGLIVSCISLILVGGLKEYRIYSVKRLHKIDICMFFQQLRLRFFNLLHSLHSIPNFMRQKFSYGSTQYTLFAIYGCISYIVPYLFFPSSTIQASSEAIVFRVVSGVLCLFLLVKDYWPPKLHKYLPIYWYLVLLVCLPLNTTFLFFLERGSVEWLLNMSLSIFILSFLVDWLSFIILTLLGIILGSILYFILIGGVGMDFSYDKVLLLAYMSLFSSLIGFLFGRNKDIHEKEKLTNLKTLAGSIAHEIITPLAAISLHAEQIKHGEVQEAKNHIISYVNRSKILINTILLNMQDEILEENTNYYSVAECIQEALSIYPFSESEKKIVHLNVENDFVTKVDKMYLVQVFLNLIKNSLYYTKYKKHPSIIISVDVNLVKFFDNGAGMNQETIIHIFKPFFTKRKGGTGIGLSFCRMVMEHVGGYIECRSIEGEFTEFILRFV